MDIHENEEKLGEMEPMTEDIQPLEDAPESEENLQPSDADAEPAELEEGSQEDVEQILVSENEQSEETENLPSDIAEEDSLDSEVIEDHLPDNEQDELIGESEEEGEPAADVESAGEDELPELPETDVPDDAPEEEIAPDPYAAVTAEEEPVKEPDDDRAWYVVHCYSGNEDKVRHNIMQRIESMSMDDLIFDVVVPTEDEVNIKNGERQTVEKKVFPGYILVNMILTEESWYMVRNTPGVTGFVGMGNDPTALQPEEVARILKRMESESPRINVTFRSGERVRIVDGPFEDFYGKVAEIDMERATVRVMVNFFGRETPVELDFLQVEQA
jgi:transcriptional antiterminator NusG